MELGASHKSDSISSTLCQHSEQHDVSLRAKLTQTAAPASASMDAHVGLGMVKAVVACRTRHSCCGCCLLHTAATMLLLLPLKRDSMRASHV